MVIKPQDVKDGLPSCYYILWLLTERLVDNSKGLSASGRPFLFLVRMDIERARKILKLSKKECSDDYIEKVIKLTRELAKLYIQNFRDEYIKEKLRSPKLSKFLKQKHGSGTTTSAS